MTRKAHIATAAAALALAVAPAAFAGPGSQVDAHDRSASTQQGTISDAVDRNSVTATATQTAGMQDSHERGTLQPELGAVVSYPEHLSDVTPSQPTVVSSGGFDWGDATIGVAGGIGLALLLGGGLILFWSHSRTRQRVVTR